MQQEDAEPPSLRAWAPGAFSGRPGWTQRWPSPGCALEHRCSFTIFRPGHKSQGGGWEGGERRKSVVFLFFFLNLKKPKVTGLGRA